MSDLVPAGEIEQIVGITRHPNRHYARAVSAERTVYILHSHKCRDSGIDLRDCRYSKALDRGIEIDVWQGHEDEAHHVTVNPLRAPDPRRAGNEGGPVSLKSAPYYWVECDGCEVSAQEGSDYTAWQQADMAEDTARDADWTTDGERWHCEDCPSLTLCDGCGKPAGELPGERDNCCQDCWAALETADG